MNQPAPKFAGIIAAGGLGARFGGLKQEIQIAGKTVLQWSIDALRPHCELIVVAVPADLSDQFRSYQDVGAHGRAPVHIVPGGGSRAQSIAKAFAKIPAAIPFVLIHDAARPAVSAELIARVKAATIEYGAAIPAIPVADTIKRVMNNTVAETLDRSTLVAAQTPQGFLTDWYREALAAPAPIGATDDASLLEGIGKTVRLVTGCPLNVKLTGPDDYPVLEKYLQSVSA